MSQHEKQIGKHRDPLERRRARNEEVEPEVLGVDILGKLAKEESERYAREHAKEV